MATKNGSTTVVTPGTPVALSATPRGVDSVIIAARSTNGGLIAIGDSTARCSPQNTILLLAGESVALGPVDLSGVFADATLAAEGIDFVTVEPTIGDVDLFSHSSLADLAVTMGFKRFEVIGALSGRPANEMLSLAQAQAIVQTWLNTAVST